MFKQVVINLKGLSLLGILYCLTSPQLVYAMSNTDSTNIETTIPSYLNVEITSSDPVISVSPLSGNYSMSILGDITTNHPGVASGGNPFSIPVNTTGSVLNLFRVPFHPVPIHTTISGTIGGVNVNVGNPMLPNFTAGHAAINLSVNIAQADLPLTLPPGTYKGTYTISATYNP